MQAEIMRRLVVMALVSKFEAFKYASKEGKDVINLCLKLKINKEKQTICFCVKIC